MRANSRFLHSWSFLLAALLLAVVSLLVIQGAMRLVNDSRALQRNQATLTSLSNLLSNQRDASAALRGYLLGLSDDQLRQRHLRAVERVQLDLQALQASLRATRDSEALDGEALSSLREKIATRAALSALSLRQFETRGPEAASRTIGDGGGMALDSLIEQSIIDLSKSQAVKLESHAQSFELSSQRLLVASSLGIPVSLLILGAVYLLLRRQIDTRIEAERAAAEWHSELNQSVEKMSDISRSMQRLSAYVGLLQTSENLDEALEITRVSLSSLLPDCGGSIYLRGHDEEGLRLAAQWNDHWADSVDSLSSHDCWAVRRSQPFVSEPSTAQLRCHHIKSGGRADEAATWCFPLFAQGEFLGLLYLSGPASMAGQTLAESASEQLSLSLANLRMRQQLREQSIRDPLTGLFNRRYLNESLTREQARCQRQQRPLSVLMLDVDHFKKFNDSHGHGGGDALLQAVGGTLRKLSRGTDIPCRYGGEEFTVILPETDAAAALAVGEKIRLAIAAMSVVYEGKPLSKVTASLGAATLATGEGNLEALMESADAALYRAKQQGRNRVLSAEAEKPVTADDHSPSASSS